ncbi:MAG: N(4)-(beta-N-acetylglucosaminyl)-L-asparaginase [Phycisphaerales bacterium]|nr:N(4)-(beta-N-acetylglucosaminyl)-L-asparaginase [Planctomycetota bacterium]MCH8508424.1 N(4)-(beta-N-acetylglucosaminyl)-L-asparaginase [Phycisphaerales bacterium]
MNNNHLPRRSFLGVSAAALTGAALGSKAAAKAGLPARSTGRPAVIASGNGLEAVRRAYSLIEEGTDPVVAVVRGVEINENDPDDMTVGYGGLPNADGVVQLDASVMHGPTHKAGAVACLEGVKNPASVALEVLRRTNHAMLVGEGAKRFALELGFKEENLLTERARQAWLRWRRNLNPRDDRLDDDQFPIPISDDDGQPIGRAIDDPTNNPDIVWLDGVPHTTGTIHCSAVDTNGDVGGCTTTSGLSWKIPGRVGDSPIIGAGMYVDNEIGAAGATGRGEAVIKSCGAFLAVRKMEEGMTPDEACAFVLRHIASRTKRPFLLNDAGEPNFNVTMYAVRKDGLVGAGCLRRGGRYAYATPEGSGVRAATPVFG